ncbi:OmpA family protein [Cronobacter universalis]|nr:OmpA family protein [Cronobacter universalis]
MAFSATLLLVRHTTLNNLCAGAALLAGLCLIGLQIDCVRKPNLRLATPVNRPLVIFIVGPFAARWFNRTGSAADLRTERDTLWLFAATAEILRTRLEQVRLKHPQADIRLWLPLLPDGYEDAAILATQLEDWQRSVARGSWRHPLPCCVAFYARLSNTDTIHWTGLQSLAPWPETPAMTPFETLEDAFDAMKATNDIASYQRSMMGKRLLGWIQTTPLKATLLSFAAHPVLRLSGIVVADDGRGFTRHGAWARFLENQYGVLPSLSSALLLPPLPPALTAASPRHTMARSGQTGGFLLGVSVVFILLAASLLHAFHQAREQIRHTTSLIARIDAIEPWQRRMQRTVLQTLLAQHQRLSQCVASPRLADWGLSPCARLQEEAQTAIDRYRNAPFFSSEAPISLFSSGSAQLRPHGPAALQPLLTLVNQHPENRFLIIGHSDKTGGPEVNQQLSENRAIAVREWLIKMTKRPAAQFEVYGLGASEPVASNDSEAGKELNRRVEVIALPVDAMKIRKFENE